jgi:hypothetical protein
MACVGDAVTDEEFVRLIGGTLDTEGRIRIVHTRLPSLPEIPAFNICWVRAQPTWREYARATDDGMPERVL